MLLFYACFDCCFTDAFVLKATLRASLSLSLSNCFASDEFAASLPSPVFTLEALKFSHQWVVSHVVHKHASQNHNIFRFEMSLEAKAHPPK
jgi:hypothetical protein